jgi:CheY-like chemotaxis protein
LESVILVVDDDPFIRKLLRIILEREGRKVELAHHGQEALDFLARGETPCMLLLDMMMPVMNGWQFFEVIKSDPRWANIPVVVITAYSEDEIELPRCEILRKPIEIPRLRHVLAKHCPPADAVNV